MTSCIASNLLTEGLPIISGASISQFHAIHILNVYFSFSLHKDEVKWIESPCRSAIRSGGWLQGDRAWKARGTLSKPFRVFSRLLPFIPRIEPGRGELRIRSRKRRHPKVADGVLANDGFGCRAIARKPIRSSAFSATFTINARPSILGGVCEHWSGTRKNIWRKTARDG